VIYNTFVLISKDFMSEKNNNINITNTICENFQILGYKKIIEMEYLKDVLEIIINAESINFQVEKLNDIIEITIENNVFKKMMEYLTTYQWNNMYQKSFENIANLLLNKYTNKKLINYFYIESDFLNTVVNKVLEPQFTYISGNKPQKINSGFFALFVEISFNIAKSENIHLKESLSHENFWNSFIIKFINPLKEKLKNGMQLPQETPFQKFNPENDSNHVNKESINEYFELCKKDLLDENKTEPEEEKVVEQKNVEQNKLNHSDISDGNGLEHDKVDFYDNNYWGRGFAEIDLDSIS